MIDTALAGHTSITDMMELTVIRLIDIRRVMQELLEERR